MSTESPAKAPLLASQLYALSQGCVADGPEECHWCSAPCLRLWIHDDPPPLIGAKRSFAKKPSRQFICMGCWLIRRKKTTIRFLDGTLKDGRCAGHYSLLITQNVTHAIESREDKELLYGKLLNPDREFALAFLDGEGFLNHLQLMTVNDLENGKSDTPIHFTVNNIPHSYTVYELTESIKDGASEGKSPGVGALKRLLGPYSLPEVKRGVGRPVKEPGKPTDKPLVMTSAARK